MTSLIYLPIALFNLPTEMPSTKAIASLVVLGVFCTGGGFISFFLVIRKMGAARASLVTYMNVMVAILLGIIVLSEPITLGILIGLPLVLVGSYLASRKHESAVIQ
jgi:drug/metabolite transporter (DMT)-like permease